MKISRLCEASGFGFGFGAFFVSFLPLSLFPMLVTMTQNPAAEKPVHPFLATRRLPSGRTTGAQQGMMDCAGNSIS